MPAGIRGPPTCVVPLTKTLLGDRSYAVAICNMLPASLHLVDDCVCFKHLLKAHICLTEAAVLSDLCLFSCAVYKLNVVEPKFIYFRYSCMEP